MGPKVELPGIRSKNFVDEILESPEFRLTLEKLSAETGRTLEDVKDEAKADLHELGAEQNSLAIGAWDKLCRRLGQAYKLDVNDKQLEKLRELNEESTLVFLPNHRSYLDPLVLRSALSKHGFEPNHTLGGVNLAFWPLGSIARRNGTVFIRREFKKAPVYRAALKAYLAYLVNHQQNLEWYIEGGRTRSGKLRPPRMGILSYLVDAFDSHATKDVLLIPTFVGYDQQYEVNAISNEEQGGKKDPESVSWLLKFARAQRVRRGRAHLRFGEPLSLRTALAETEATGDNRLAVPKIAFEVMHRINEATPVMPSALVTFALLDNDDRALTIEEGREILTPLMHYIHHRGLDLSEDMELLSDQGAIYDAIATLVREGIIERYDGGLEPVYRVAEDRQHEAAFYRNTLIHFFITRAILEVALVRAVEEGNDDPISATWDEAVRLRDLLKYEFFFSRKSLFLQDILREAEIAEPGWQEEHFDSVHLLQSLQMSKLYLAPRVFGPFLEGYGIVADRLVARDPDAAINRADLIQECIGVGQQRWLQKDLHSPESISRDLFSGALELADNRGLLEPGTPGLKGKREAFAQEFKDAMRRVDVIREMARLKEEAA